ncbi:putative superoxide dismutase copper chaperone [Phaeomoniella chlamydospora]|uniref:Superoxide dismutase 1 copper chaperone n=1 Tax=Phaeomoniella chlamydospora TaxID=158046 RepID=A0A0G2E2L4_PHACM|nr:putative superoxide dismutase copper chaperone [Phaeomoniella chlamydospora]
MGSLGIDPFQTTFAVPLHCDGCVQDVSGALNKLEGITKVQANLQDQLVFVEGTTAPSQIVSAIEATGRDAILRGSGKSNSAAVCILETHSTSVRDKVRGLARMVEVGPNMTLVDLTIRGLPAGRYQATVRDTGDISRGAASTGGIWEAAMTKLRVNRRPRGHFGVVEVGKDGKGSAFLDKPLSIWEIIGRSMVVSSQEREGKFEQEDPDTLVGVIARSAGVWDNDKTVCSCSGMNVWEERKEQVGRGML